MITKEFSLELAQACRVRASRVGFPPLRWALMEIADHHERDAVLVESSLQTVIESRRLIAAAAELLRHRERPEGEAAVSRCPSISGPELGLD